MSEDIQNLAKVSQDASEGSPLVVDTIKAVITEDNESVSKAISSNEEESVDLDLSLLASIPLTYENTKNSSFYNKAKDKLQSGDFESVMATIECGITSILSLLPQSDEMHECIAPLYYLYGTTLLYSIEESQESAENTVMAAEQQENGENSAEDLQIAWENLETARSILVRSKGDHLTEEERDDRAMDLAQIYCRLGDLSRHNGIYDQAIEDYMTCCDGRRQILKGEKVWDRKIADVEYNLGMTCLLFAAEGEKNFIGDADEDQKGGEPASGSGDIAKASITAASAVATSASSQNDEEGDNKVHLSPDQIKALREKSARHYVQCSRILAGLIGIMCGQTPDDIAAADCNLESIDDKKMSSESSKVSSKDKEVNVQAQASEALKMIRSRVSNLKPLDFADSEKIHDLREMLDEIQETLDTAEEDKEGLRDITLMRKKAEEDANKSDEPNNAESKEEFGSTTIGFGQETSAFASEILKPFAASAKQNVQAAPMMVVKKKKKRDISESTDEETAKRVKN